MKTTIVELLAKLTSTAGQGIIERIRFVDSIDDQPDVKMLVIHLNTTLTKDNINQVTNYLKSQCEGVIEVVAQSRIVSVWYKQ